MKSCVNEDLSIVGLDLAATGQVDVGRLRPLIGLPDGQYISTGAGPKKRPEIRRVVKGDVLVRHQVYRQRIDHRIGRSLLIKAIEGGIAEVLIAAVKIEL